MTRTSSARSRLAGAAIGGLSLAALAACGAQSGARGGPAAEQSNSMSRYVQTWSKSYDRTSCTEWTARMTDRQRWTAALDMLKDARSGDDAFAYLPDDRLVDRFQAAIGARCAAAGDDTVAQAGAQVYLSAKRTYKP